MYPCATCNDDTDCITCDGNMINRQATSNCNCESRYYNEYDSVHLENVCKECPERYD